MKQIVLILLMGTACLLPLSAQTKPADAQTKAYESYTEAYRKAAVSYGQASEEAKTSSAISWGIMFVCFTFVVFIGIRAQRRQKRYFDAMLAIGKDNQKVLEEIRDSLKK